jgi:hypothetical protein
MSTCGDADDVSTDVDDSALDFLIDSSDSIGADLFLSIPFLAFINLTVTLLISTFILREM